MQTIRRTIDHGVLHIDIEARAATGFDGYVERSLFRRFVKLVTGAEYVAGTEWGPELIALDQLVPVINRTVAVTGLPVSWPTAQSPDHDLCAGYEYLKEIPFKVWVTWIEIIEEADQAPGDPDLAPPETLTHEQKKIPKS